MKRKKNNITFVILALLLINLVTAELVEIETDIYLRVDNRTITVETENKDFEFECGEGAGSPGEKTIAFTRELTCTNEAELTHLAMILSDSVNNTRDYYELYLECYASERVCQQKLGGNLTISSGVDYESKYTEAFENYNNCKSERTSAISQRQAAESELSTCETDKKEAEDGKLTYGVIGAVAGLAAYYFLFDKSRKKPAESSAEQQLPTRR